MRVRKREIMREREGRGEKNKERKRVRKVEGERATERKGGSEIDR